MTYDSRPDTYAHIQRVQEYLHAVVNELLLRAEAHDASKLVHPEVETFDEHTPKLKDLTYGSDEYKASLAAMKPALEHHYANNSHHPEHFSNGIRGMSLLDVIEMLCDWKAASERLKGGTRDEHAVKREQGGTRGVVLDQERFGFTDELRDIMDNTLREMGWKAMSDSSHSERA